AARTQYILLSNTKALYSTVMFGKGITNDSSFIERALRGIRALMEDAGQGAGFERFVAPASATVRFAKALNRSVTGTMSDLAKHATYLLAAGDVSPFDVGNRLNDTPLSALRHGGSAYGFPRDVFRTLVASAGGERPVSDP